MKFFRYGAIIAVVLLVAGLFFSWTNQEATSTPTNTASTVQPTSTAKAETKTTGGLSSTEVTDESSSTESDERTDEILVVVAGDITTLDPYRMVSIHPEGSISVHLWDTLTLLNDDLEIEPHLAESWRLVNNFTWEFKLREGLTFHNGEPLNADAVRFSIERAQSLPDSLETFADDVGLEQVELIDDYTLRLTTHQPVANLPYYLAFLEILPPIYYTEADLDQLAKAPVGSGPYQLDSWDQGKTLTLEAAPSYWKGAPMLSRLIFKTVPLAQERLAALRLEEADLATDLPPIPESEWDITNTRLVAVESTQRMLIGINTKTDTPLAETQVRQALNYAIDINQIVEDLLAGYGERYGSWVNPPANNPELTPWPYDPDLARDLLAQAGYREGFTTTLRAPEDTYYQDVAIAQTVAQQLGQVGVTVEVETVNWTMYANDLINGDVPPLFLLRLNSRGNGLEDTKNLSSSFRFNPTGWQNEAFEETLRRATNSFNDSSRDKLLAEAQALAYDEAPWIWLWRPYHFYGIGSGLDWTPRRDGLINLYKPATVLTDSVE